MSLPPLSSADAAWVARTRDSLSTDAKIAQLFNFAVRDSVPEEVESLIALGVGAYHRFPGSDLATARGITRRLLAESIVPPLVSGDIEGGGISFGFATAFPNQLGIAACDDLALSAEIARMVARESLAMGFNWSFAPVVDVNAAFRSTIVGTRSYGSDPARVLAQARTYVRALQAEGIAATAKHWPGEGYDERDQHLLTTVNPLPMEQWRAVFGTIYRTLIDDGLLSIMAGHIALPAWHGEIGRDAFVPASLSRALNVDLLRRELGFDGLLISDATVMAGMATWMDRAQAVPAVIENGCDMFLFSRDAAADVAHMRAGLHAGLLSEARLEEAVTRVLTLKARLGLHRTAPAERLPDHMPALRAPEHIALAAHAAARSLTLVKDVTGLLPLDPAKSRRILLLDEGEEAIFIDGAPKRSFAPLVEGLEAAGFVVRRHDPAHPPSRDDTDLLLYLVGHESTPVVASNRIDWIALHGGAKKAMTRFWPAIPALMVSFGHPYLLHDAPDVPAYVNAYSAIPAVQAALAAALSGKTGFSGVSPVDPFCGRPAARF